ncbi:MAG TPA: DNA repair exonuclease [Gemmatimonadales bacterium]|nr:DNA repair exonuclease [Gemmatimonadales bacterium]
MRVLLSGDIHIGRRSSRLPSDADPRATSSTAAWHALVQCAIDQRADVLALSGDIVDQTNGFYEAFGPLESGLRRLREADVHVVAVCGNHDYAALPQLVGALPDGLITLIGAGGQWERHTIERNGEQLHVDGWSFNAPHVRHDPLSSYSFPHSTHTPVLGLLHADLDQAGSIYAPVRLADLTATPVSLWLLGHVHCHALHNADGATPVLYPGSPNPLDPGEPGEHGAWMVEFSPGRPVEPRLVPIARVRYHTLQLDVSDVSDTGAFREMLLQQLRRSAEDMCVAPLEYLSIRLRLTGRTTLGRELENEVRLLRDDLDMELQGVRVHVEKVELHARAAHSLESLAAGSDAASHLARLLLALEDGAVPGEFSQLIGRVEALPGMLQSERQYASLPSVPHDPTSGDMRSMLAQQASLLLDAIIDRKESAA